MRGRLLTNFCVLGKTILHKYFVKNTFKRYSGSLEFHDLYQGTIDYYRGLLLLIEATNGTYNLNERSNEYSEQSASISACFS